MKPPPGTAPSRCPISSPRCCRQTRLGAPACTNTLCPRHLVRNEVTQAGCPERFSQQRPTSVLLIGEPRDQDPWSSGRRRTACSASSIPDISGIRMSEISIHRDGSSVSRESACRPSSASKTSYPASTRKPATILRTSWSSSTTSSFTPSCRPAGLPVGFTLVPYPESIGIDNQLGGLLSNALSRPEVSPEAAVARELAPYRTEQARHHHARRHAVGGRPYSGPGASTRRRGSGGADSVAALAVSCCCLVSSSPLILDQGTPASRWTNTVQLSSVPSLTSCMHSNRACSSTWSSDGGVQRCLMSFPGPCCCASIPNCNFRATTAARQLAPTV